MDLVVISAIFLVEDSECLESSLLNFFPLGVLIDVDAEVEGLSCLVLVGCAGVFKDLKHLLFFQGLVACGFLDYQRGQSLLQVVLHGFLFLLKVLHFDD